MGPESIRLETLDDSIDHVRGGPAGRVILEYGDYECPYSRLANHEIELDVPQFDRDRASAAVMVRIGRDVESAIASGEVTGTPTIFIDGVVHRGAYDAATLLEALL